MILILYLLYERFNKSEFDYNKNFKILIIWLLKNDQLRRTFRDTNNSSKASFEKYGNERLVRSHN